MTSGLRAKVLKAVAGAALCVGMATSASAANGAAWGFETASQDFSNGVWVFAQSFSVKEEVKATGLGWYASPTNGQVADNPVALYECSNLACDGTATLLASAIVTNVFPIQGKFRFVTIDEVTLLPDVGYQVAGVSNNNNYTWNNGGFTVNSVVNFEAFTGRWESGGTVKFLNYVRGDVSDGYWGPNVFLGEPTFTNPIPEPATWAMMIAGFGLVGFAMRRREKMARVAA